LRTLFLLPAFGVLLLCLLCSALATGASPTIDVAAIKPGMKGYGLTVFRGVRPERFDVEVIDVLRSFRPDQDLILVRTPHPVLDKAIVVGGMSGSPVYLDGKLAGAYAYGWLFGKEPIAGVTPIKNMLTELVRPVDPSIWRLLDSRPRGSSALTRRERERAWHPRERDRPELAGLPPFLGRTRVGAFDALRAYADRYAPAQVEGAVRMARAVTPLMLSGLSEQAVAVLGSELERFGMVGLQAGGGGGGTPGAGAERFVDGGAIGVQLIRGDINATGIGTVTHVAGNRLIAFGHPMMNAGQPALPTATAKVLHVLASERRSFKIAEPIQPLGTLIHDRQAAIVIDTDLTADTVPLQIRVRGAEGAPRTLWNVEVASQRALTPMLSFAALFNAMSATAAETNDVVFTAKSRVKLGRHGTVEVVDQGYSPMGLANPMALSQLRLFDVLAVAYGNPFEPVRVEGIEIDLELRFERNYVRIVDAMVSSTEVDPGSDVNVYLTLRRYGEQEELRIVPVHVPHSAAGEKIEILFQPGDVVKPEQPVPDSVEQLLDDVQAGYPATTLVVSTKLPSTGLRLRGHVVDHLPGSALDMLKLTGEAEQPKSFVTHARKELPLQQVLVGAAGVKLEVRDEPLR
jgi:hypothetical protein